MAMKLPETVHSPYRAAVHKVLVGARTQLRACADSGTSQGDVPGLEALLAQEAGLADTSLADPQPRPGVWAVREAARLLLSYADLEHPARMTDSRLLSRLRTLDELPLQRRIELVADAAERTRARSVTTVHLPPPPLPSGGQQPL
ncbi:hypothetical protein H9Y04_43385 [Streptomyces sp. TRM66268-LWL]|uniref:Uncharacterized protein n=1 Tax=Streptomyces polyasparticus TaxID=2767826 RepID=A0ABR7SV58_9ACTN|nr:hypothetical protein [Streptomyces polyasparticus]MBC9719375.1 hypothetical protein [Streptomyces polyasparticus]